MCTEWRVRSGEKAGRALFVTQAGAAAFFLLAAVAASAPRVPRGAPGPHSATRSCVCGAARRLTLPRSAGRGPRGRGSQRALVGWIRRSPLRAPPPPRRPALRLSTADPFRSTGARGAFSGRRGPLAAEWQVRPGHVVGRSLEGHSPTQGPRSARGAPVPLSQSPKGSPKPDTCQTQRVSG